MFLKSCSSYDCTKVDNTPCGTLCEQAKNLVEKLLEHPDDWICILENEKCIDCSNFLQNVFKDDKLRISVTKQLITYSRLDCDFISDCYQSIHLKTTIIPGNLSDTKVYVISVNRCDHEIYDSNDNPQQHELHIEFKIINENQWELFYFGSP